jgi:hypothetical protein
VGFPRLIISAIESTSVPGFPGLTGIISLPQILHAGKENIETISETTDKKQSFIGPLPPYPIKNLATIQAPIMKREFDDTLANMLRFPVEIERPGQAKRPRTVTQKDGDQHKADIGRGNTVLHRGDTPFQNIFTKNCAACGHCGSCGGKHWQQQCPTLIESDCCIILRCLFPFTCSHCRICVYYQSSGNFNTIAKLGEEGKTLGINSNTGVDEVQIKDDFEGKEYWGGLIEMFLDSQRYMVDGNAYSW